MQRQNDGFLPPFPIWDDVRTFDGRVWRGIVQVVSGGFPCTDISPAKTATSARQGLNGEFSGLWVEQKRIIWEVQSPFAFIENVPSLRKFGLCVVLADLAEMGFSAEWCVLSARAFGASHERERIWIAAYNSKFARLQGFEPQLSQSEEFPRLALGKLFPRTEYDLPKPRCLGAGNGVAHFVERLRAVGNGQVPAVAAAAWSQLVKRLI